MDKKQHIEYLIKTHNIIVKSHSSGGRSWRKKRTIAIRPVKTSITYAIALHEIGHILGTYPKLRLEKELAAWSWAKENSIEWTMSMQNVMDRCMKSYIDKAKRGKLKMIEELNNSW